MKAVLDSVFYVDEDLDSNDFVNPLLEVGFKIERHRDNFPPGATDDTWIPEVARRGWYAFSHDFNIVRTKTQTKMVLNCELGLFIVRGKTKEKAHHIMGENVAKTKLAIDQFVKKNFRPFIASVRNPDKKSGKGTVVGLRPIGREWGKGKMLRQRR